MALDDWLAPARVATVAILATVEADKGGSVAEVATVATLGSVAEAPKQVANNEGAADDGMRACIDCANLSRAGRCLAAERGESMGAGIATSRTWRPGDPTRPQRCGAYKPGPADSDRRTGAERWPFLFGEQSPVNASARPRATGYAIGGPTRW